jgi:diguanylate cyclase (GGDEF)-like protein
VAGAAVIEARLSSRRSLFELSWKYILLIMIGGMLITAMLARSQFLADRSGDDALNTTIAASVALQIGTSVGEFYTPTIAGEGFVSSVVVESQDLDVPERQILDTSFEPFVEPIIGYLGPALLDFQLAPAGLVTYSAQPERNASAIGHNLFLDDDRREVTLATVAQRQPVVSGPIELIQGGTGLIIRQAIFLQGLTPFVERYEEWSGDTQTYPWMAQVPNDFWGFATTVIDFNMLISGVNFRGLDPDQYALRVVDEDGQATERIYGEHPQQTSHTVGQRFTLPDGSLWEFQVNVVRSPIWGVWPILLAGLAATSVIAFLAARGYSVWRRNRLGYLFGQELTDISERQDILITTARFLSRAVPEARGSISSAVPEPLVVRIPVDQPADASPIEDNRSWMIFQSGELQAVIRVDDSGRWVERRLGEAVEVIESLLAASLAAVSRRSELERISKVDQLTEVFNRRQFQPSFDELSEVACRNNLYLAVGVIDIDDFKSLNDSFGHLFGDEVLRELGVALSQSVRGQDAVFRFGGDEFVVLCLLADATDALQLFERIKYSANKALTNIAPDRRVVTISIGYVVNAPICIEPMNELLAKADQALYRAKRAGRDRVEDWDLIGTGTGPMTPIR